MLYDGFINICRHEGQSPTRVLAALNISKGSLSRWIGGGSPTKMLMKNANESLYDKRIAKGPP